MNTHIVSAVQKVDTAFFVILGISAVILLGITLATLIFLYKYHHRRNQEPADIHGSVVAELVWTIIPTLIVIGLFWFGWASFSSLRDVPDSAMEVQVEARMWSWSFIYESGKRSPDLYVPVNTPVKLTMTSVDVIHSFYAPAFRIKMDTVPGLQTYAWFLPDQEGEFDVLCAEYCGLKHADMLATIHVVSAQDYAAWLAGEKEMTASAEDLLETYGCTGCHSLDGSAGVGPTLKDIHGKPVKVTTGDGSVREVIRDRAYLRTALVEPEAEIVEGYDAIMSSTQGLFSPEEMEIIMAFLIGNGVGNGVGNEVGNETGNRTQEQP